MSAVISKSRVYDEGKILYSIPFKQLHPVELAKVYAYAVIEHIDGPRVREIEDAISRKYSDLQNRVEELKCDRKS
jgi:hypothetical protein